MLALQPGHFPTSHHDLISGIKQNAVLNIKILKCYQEINKKDFSHVKLTSRYLGRS